MAKKKNTLRRSNSEGTATRNDTVPFKKVKTDSDGRPVARKKKRGSGTDDVPLAGAATGSDDTPL